jgi:antitoxin (DNA-binding transcriptional repressor) of toxin-antitoxin stability system
MRSINVAQLKAQLSACLRLAQSGERIVVLDRRQPIAEIVPLQRAASS